MRDRAAAVACAALLAACSGEPKPTLPESASSPAASLSASPTAKPPSSGAPTASSLASVAPTTSVAPTATAAQATPMENAPQLTASLKPPKSKIGKPIFIKITAKNAGAELVRVSDPRTGSGSLVFKLTPPGASEKTAPLGPLQGGAVKPQVLNISVLPGTSTDIEVQLDPYFPLDTPGNYKLVLEYTWKPGTTWRSPDLTFTREPK